MGYAIQFPIIFGALIGGIVGGRLDKRDDTAVVAVIIGFITLWWIVRKVFNSDENLFFDNNWLDGLVLFSYLFLIFMYIVYLIVNE